jgi:pimeloyl-ACP methyl ester carboxylesterase
MTVGCDRWNRRAVARLLLGAALVPGLAASARAAAIAETAYVPLGGLEQWIDIKGEERANPVILVVHGGPGEAQWPQADKYGPWQKSFTVVQWDQRGASHTYGHSGGENTPGINLKRLSTDGVELAEYLCRHLDKKKIIVLGHSWGSIIAVTMVQARPDLFAAYVGTGQVESWKASVQSQFDLLLAKARADKNQAAVKELEAIGTPDPTDTHQYFTFSRNIFSAWPKSDQDWVAHLREQAKQHAGEKDFADHRAGQILTGNKVLADQVAADLSQSGRRIDTAFFVIQGQDDVITPTAAARDYFDHVEAPQKEWVAIPGAGHFAFMTHGDAFLAALTDKVRPVAVARGA